MKAFITELIRHSSRANQDMIAVLTQNHGLLSGRTMELISHILNAHHIWNARAEGSKVVYGIWQVHALDTLAETDQFNTQKSLAILERFEPGQNIEFQTMSGARFVNTIGEFLSQIITHSAYHRGQIAIELRQVGIKPPQTDFIYYKMQKSSL